MKNYFSLLMIILVMVGTTVTCQAQSNSLPIVDSIQLKAEELKKLYFEVTNAPEAVSEVYKRKFFYAFPNTFKEFNELYGYNDNRNDDNDHTPIIQDPDASNQIWKLFKNLDDIVGDTLYYRKLINISTGGYWEADAVNLFKSILQDYVLSKPALVVCLLKKMPDKQIKGFWYFYFDEPIPQKAIPEKLSVIKEADTHMYSLMEATLKEVQQSWKDK